MRRLRSSSLSVIAGILVSTALAGCAPSAAPTATSVAAKPPATAAASKPAASPAAAAPPAPAGSPATAASPAVVAASPAAKPVAAFDEVAVANFYRGKTGKVIVGFAPGGGYDIFARLVARHLGTHLPGNPSFIVENRPGAGSLVAANAVYNTEPKDGTILLVFAELVVLQQAIEAPGIQLDARKMLWLGANARTNNICMVRNDANVSNIRELMGGRELTASTTGRGTSAYDFPAILNAVLGTRFKLVTGYSGGAEAIAAFEKGEADTLCGSGDAFLGRTRRMLEGPEAFAKVVVHSGAQSPEASDVLLQGVPSARDLATTEEGKQTVAALDAPSQMLRPLAAGPEIPQDRALALRQATATMFKDQRFLDDLKQSNINYSLDGLSTGEEVDRVVDGLFRTPPAVIENLKKIIGQ
jgi:tripartite-type tricarboxylate transporter receptor subunit TctC